MAENRLIGDYPVIGIRPTIDGRRGPLKVRESLEDQTMGMAKAAAKLISENLRYSNGEPVKVIIADTTIGRVAESAACADKFKKAGFHALKSDFVNAPLIEELPMALECELISYDPQMCHLVGKIVNVSADESILDEKGKIDPGKLRPISFDPVHNDYLIVSERIGKAFKDGTQLIHKKDQ